MSKDKERMTHYLLDQMNTMSAQMRQAEVQLEKLYDKTFHKTLIGFSSVMRDWEHIMVHGDGMKKTSEETLSLYDPKDFTEDYRPLCSTEVGGKGKPGPSFHLNIPPIRVEHPDPDGIANTVTEAAEALAEREEQHLAAYLEDQPLESIRGGVCYLDGPHLQLECVDTQIFEISAYLNAVYFLLGEDTGAMAVD